MKKLVAVFLIFAVLFSCFEITEGAAEKPVTDYTITKKLCKRVGYSNIKMINPAKMSEKKLWNLIDNRMHKSYIIVECIESVSDGKTHGWYTTKDGNKYIIGYNKKVKKGRKVTSYVIWNPNSCECDDVLYVVDNKEWR